MNGARCGFVIAMPLLGWIGVAACSGTPRAAIDETEPATDDASSPLESGPGSFDDAGALDGGPDVETVLYAHTNTTLFRLRAGDATAAPERVGDFDCVKGTAVVTDIAVDRKGRLSGVSQGAVYPEMKIDGTTVRCGSALGLRDTTRVFYGAAYAPAGTLDPTNETLIVAGTDGVLYSVEPAGELIAVGHFGDVPADDGNGHAYRSTTVGKRWELSGDIVFLENAGGSAVGFATVRDCPSPPSTAGCNLTDTLVELSPSLLSRTSPRAVTSSVRGLIVRSPSCADTANAGYGSIFGIASLFGDVFGFARARGEAGAAERALVVKISNADGTACLVHDATPSVSTGWAGGGVTTLAPVVAPPPK